MGYAEVKVGFTPVGAEWPSTYVNKKLVLFLVIYVDDFKLSGPRSNMTEGWRLLRKGLTIEPEKPSGLYLGCLHEIGQLRLPRSTPLESESVQGPHSGMATTVTYNM